MATHTIGAGQDYATIQAFLDDVVNLEANPTGEIQDGSAFNETLSGPDLAFTLTVAAAARHDGTPGSGARVVSSSGHSWGDGNVVRWLEFDWAGANPTGNGMNVGPGDNAEFYNLIAHGLHYSRTNDMSVFVTGGGFSGMKVKNCLVFDCSNASSGDIIAIRAGGDETTEIENNTITGITSNSGGARGIQWEGAQADHTMRNNLVTDVTTTSGTALCYEALSAVGTSTTASNGSDDATSPDGASFQNLTVAFEDAANDDYRLASGDDGIDAGTDLGAGDAAIDLLGRDRDAEADTWDLGAFEFVAGAGGTTILPLMMAYHS